MLFGFPADTDPHSDKLLKNDLFKKHATFLLNMIGKTVKMLGFCSLRKVATPDKVPPVPLLMTKASIFPSCLQSSGPV